MHDPLAIRLAHPYTGAATFPARVPMEFTEALQGQTQQERKLGDFGGKHGVFDPAKGEEKAEGFAMYEKRLQKLASDNPIATTLVFNQRLENVRSNLIGRSKQRKTNDALDARAKGMWGVSSSNHDVKECNDRASLHVHGQHHGGASPALIADLAADPELRNAVTRAIDSQVCGELPLEYHAAYLAQDRLRVAKRRDAAYDPPPLPSKEEFDSRALYAWDRARYVDYKTYLDQAWWPEFAHHAYVVVMNRHTHEHSHSCNKTERGKIGCRFCAPWPHHVPKTSVHQLRMMTADGPPPDGAHDLRCPVCFADGALSECHKCELSVSERELALEREAQRRDLYFTAHDPDPPGCGEDERTLAVEIRRRLLPVEAEPQEVSERGGVDGRLAAAMSNLTARHDPAQHSAGRASQREPTSREPQFTDALDKLVLEATKARRPWRYFERHRRLPPDELFAEARSTLRRLTADGQKLHQLLARREFRALRDRLAELSADPPSEVDPLLLREHNTKEAQRVEELLGLLDDWTWTAEDAPKRPCVMACRNGIIADFTIGLAGCIKSNAVPIHLGAGAGSKAAAMYQIKYMGKESVGINASAQLLVEAHKHVNDELTASTAEDAGEPERIAKHFMQHVINSSNMELEATQAAGVVLGIGSSGGSENIDYLGAWDLVKVAGAVSKGELDVSLSHVLDEEEDRGEGNVQGADAEGEDEEAGEEGEEADEEEDEEEAEEEEDEEEEDEEEEDEEADGEDEEDNEPEPVIDLLQHFHCDGGDTEGSSHVFHDAKGNPVVVSAAQHYACRDARLACFNAHEFHRAFQLRKMDSKPYPRDRPWYAVQTRLLPRLRGAAHILRMIAQGLGSDHTTAETRTILLHVRGLLRERIGGGDVDERPAAVPLTRENAKGRLVLVPRERYPLYDCDEHGGAGWQAKIERLGSTARWAYVNYTHAKDEAGAPYKREWIELAFLQPLARERDVPRAGRPCERYLLREPHKLHDSHILVRRAKWGVPALAGKPPPNEPDPDKPNTRARRDARRAFARYYCSIFVPWTAWSAPALTYQSWTEHLKKLAEGACLYGPREEDYDEPARRARLIAAARLSDIENMTQGFKAPKASSAMLMKHRSRYRTFWTDRNRPPLSASCVNGEQRTAAKEIQKLREKAERLRGKKDITTRLRHANNVKSFTELLQKHLPSQIATKSVAAGSKLRELWKSASAPARRTTRGVPREPKHVSDANAKPMPAQNVTPLRDVIKNIIFRPPSFISDSSTLPAESPFAEISDAAYDQAAAKWKADKDAGRPVGNPPLNPEQREGGRDFLCMARLRAAVLQRGEPAEAIARAVDAAKLTPVITLTIGAGGTGKSEMVHELSAQMSALGCGHLLVTAYTGVAAAPFKGPTLLSLLGLNIESRKAKRIEQLTHTRREMVRKKFKDECGVEIDDIGGIVIDEVSFNELEIFGHLDGRLRQLTGNLDVACGGIPLLLCGDNHQKPPTTGSPWYRDMVKDAEEGGVLLAGGPSTSKARGLGLLRAARRVQLWRNMRARDDQPFVKVQEQMRDTHAEMAVPADFIRKLRMVSKADLAADPEWMFAPVGVLQHVERDVINVAQAKVFARTFGLPLIRWRLEMVDEIENKSLLSDLYEDEDNLWGYFVEGAPVNLTENMASTRGLVNGSAGILDSLSFERGAIPRELQAAHALAASKRGVDVVVVDLTEAPLSVNVRVGGTRSPPGKALGSAPGSVLWHGVELDDLSGLIETVTTDGAQVVPLLKSKKVRKEGIALNGIVAAQNNVAEKVQVKVHEYKLAFALTDFKLQGRTLPKLIINVFKRNVPPWMSLASFYVLISRCKTADSLRLYQYDREGLNDLYRLKHDEYLAAWEDGYDENGRWSDKLAVAALERTRHTRKQAKADREAKKAAKAAEAIAAKRKEAAAARRHTEKTKQATTRAGRAGPPSPIAIPPLQSPPPDNVERVRTRSVG